MRNLLALVVAGMALAGSWKFSDPGFLQGRALAQFVGTATLRLADADILPYEFTGLADTVQTYVARCRRSSSGRTMCTSGIVR